VLELLARAFRLVSLNLKEVNEQDKVALTGEIALISEKIGTWVGGAELN
jgi:hypothetical protein